MVCGAAPLGRSRPPGRLPLPNRPGQGASRSPGGRPTRSFLAPDTRAADLLAELSKSTYTAKRAIPASDSIFIEEGRVIESLRVVQGTETLRTTWAPVLRSALTAPFGQHGAAPRSSMCTPPPRPWARQKEKGPHYPLVTF